MIRAWRGNLATLHLNDNYGLIRPVFEDLHLFPGYGTLEWKPIFDALRDIRFRGVPEHRAGRGAGAYAAGRPRHPAAGRSPDAAGACRIIILVYHKPVRKKSGLRRGARRVEKNTHTPRPLHLAQAEPLLRERLEATVVLTVTGGSMLPLLVSGRDRVTLGPVPERLRRGEVLLYRRADGSYVLHRLTGFGQDGTLVFCGDRQTEPERGSGRSRSSRVLWPSNEKGHFFTRRAPGYRVYCALWPRLRWCRQAIFHLRAVLPGNGRKGQK